MRSRLKIKGRRDSGSFAALPHVILDSTEYSTLSARSVKCLLDVFAQYRGSNNGDLAAAWTVMKKRGWRSKDSLCSALRELCDAGFLILTRQGGRSKRGGQRLCTLYAVSWLRIDECGRKLDVLPTKVASGTWRIKTTAPPAGHTGPESGPVRGRITIEPDLIPVQKRGFSIVNWTDFRSPSTNLPCTMQRGSHESCC